MPKASQQQFSGPEPAPTLEAALGYAIALGWLTPQQAHHEFRKFPSTADAGAALDDKAAAALKQFMIERRSSPRE